MLHTVHSVFALSNIAAYPWFAAAYALGEEDEEHMCDRARVCVCVCVCLEVCGREGQCGWTTRNTVRVRVR